MRRGYETRSGWMIRSVADYLSPLALEAFVPAVGIGVLLMDILGAVTRLGAAIVGVALMTFLGFFAVLDFSSDRNVVRLSTRLIFDVAICAGAWIIIFVFLHNS